MSQNTESAPTITPPALSVVPTPTAEEQLARAAVEIDRLSNERAKEREQYNALVRKLREIEENPLAFTLSNLDAGAVLTEAGDQFKTLCAAVHKRQEKGTFTLKLAVKPFKDAIIVTGDVKIVEPRPDAAQSVFYATEDGVLTRQDPRQKEFGFAGRNHRAEDAAEADERRHPNLR